MKTNKISIITSVYNDCDNISVNIDNITDIYDFNIQWIVVDGGSTDGTLELLRENVSVIDILISEKDGGIYDAWNKGLDFVSGRWVLFAGAGDKIYSDWISKLQNEPNDVGFLYGDIMMRTEDGFLVKKISADWDIAKKKIKTCLSIPLIGTAHSANLFECQRYNENYKIVGDWDFVIRNINAGGRYCKGVRQAEMMLGGVSNQASFVKKKIIERKMIKKANGIINMNFRDYFLFGLSFLSKCPFLYKYSQTFWYLIRNSEK